MILFVSFHFKAVVSYLVVHWLKEGGTRQLNQWVAFQFSFWLGELLSPLLARTGSLSSPTA